MSYKEMNGSLNFRAEKMITKTAVKHFSKIFFGQALLPLSSQRYCGGSKPSPTLSSKIAEKKILKIFSSFFRILFSKSLLTFWAEKGFQISIFLLCITISKRKKILSLLAASLGNARSKVALRAHLFAAFSRAHRSTQKNFCAREKRFAKLNCSN